MGVRTLTLEEAISTTSRVATIIPGAYQFYAPPIWGLEALTPDPIIVRCDYCGQKNVARQTTDGRTVVHLECRKCGAPLPD